MSTELLLFRFGVLGRILPLFVSVPVPWHQFCSLFTLGDVAVLALLRLYYLGRGQGSCFCCFAHFIRNWERNVLSLIFNLLFLRRTSPLS